MDASSIIGPQAREPSAGASKAVLSSAGKTSSYDQRAESPKVAILLCTFNGEKYLREQLDSFLRQTHRNWILWVSDDGSKDRTLEIVVNYYKCIGQTNAQLVSGPSRGFVANFLGLTCRKDICADYFAWSDQDDVWHEEKIETALNWLQSVPSNVPALYCGRTQLVTSDNVACGLSPNFRINPNFSNALVQSIAGGNTMLFNQAARDLIIEAGASVIVPSHDWWIYQLVSGGGGVVRYDPNPLLHYRQHNENLIGSNSGYAARIHRLKMIFNGRFCDWNAQNIRALEAMQHRLTPLNQQYLQNFKSARDANFLPRVLGVIRARLHRQTFLGNLGLILATLLKKI